MDGVHDLGGKQGYGPIDVSEPLEPFHAEWEGRVWGISHSYGAPDAPIDWWRHIRETSVPVDYLTRPYFDSWIETEMVTYVDSGICTLKELTTGTSASVAKDKATPINVRGVVEGNRARATKFNRPVDVEPKYTIGDNIIARLNASPGHTRLPGYVRGRPGEIHSHHGAHLFPDAVAKGIEEAEHLYTVAFKACDLWPESRDSKDIIFLDLWESYLDPR